MSVNVTSFTMRKDNSSDDSGDKVWRYMSFSRFVWLLQRKQLWLSRADLLGDPWEIPLVGEQLEHLIRYHPISPLGEGPSETAMERAERIITLWRRHTFVSCWSASIDESHALWRIYCPTHEGVALETTIERLQKSVGDIPVYRVKYEALGKAKVTPTHSDLVTRKRSMFQYEQEVRVVSFSEEELDDEPQPAGRPLAWEPGQHLHGLRVHPAADQSFMETVSEVVERYAPALKDHVAWSAMRERPPF